MKNKSWVCTLITQLSLCVAFYVVLNIGQPRTRTEWNVSGGEGGPLDLYFVTVSGGFRPPEEQTLLLQQMVKLVKALEARFVVVISELGGSDPLLQKAIKIPQLKSIPRYATGDLRIQGKTYFLKRIESPRRQTLDIIALDTTLFQDTPSVRGNDQILWLKRTLNESVSDWRVAVGYHELISCDDNTQKMEASTRFAPLQNILLSYGVDAYISIKSCDGHGRGGAAGLSITGVMDKVPYLNIFNQDLVFHDSSMETGDAILLHQISSLEMATFAVKLTGEVEHKISFQQRARAAM